MLTKDKKKSGLSLELAVTKGSICQIAHEEDEDLVCKQATTIKEEFRHVLPMPACVADANEQEEEEFPVCQEGLLSATPSSNNSSL